MKATREKDEEKLALKEKEIKSVNEELQKVRAQLEQASMPVAKAPEK